MIHALHLLSNSRCKFCLADNLRSQEVSVQELLADPDLKLNDVLWIIREARKDL